MISAEESSQELAGVQDTFVVRALDGEGNRVYLTPAGQWTTRIREALQFEAKGAVELDVRRMESVPITTRRPHASGGVITRERPPGGGEAA